MILRIPLPWDRPPITNNGAHGHWHAASKARKDAIEVARWKALKNTPRWPIPCQVEIVWEVTTRHRRDCDGLALTQKVCLDAAVKEGLIPDDNWTIVARTSQRIQLGEEQRMWLEVRDA